MKDFTETSKVIMFENGLTKVVYDVSRDATRWDGAPDTIKQSVYSEVYDVHTYCEIKIQSRTKMNYIKGVWGKRCKIRFWRGVDCFDGRDYDFGGWESAVIFDKDQKIDW